MRVYCSPRRRALKVFASLTQRCYHRAAARKGQLTNYMLKPRSAKTIPLGVETSSYQYHNTAMVSRVGTAVTWFINTLFFGPMVYGKSIASKDLYVSLPTPDFDVNYRPGLGSHHFLSAPGVHPVQQGYYFKVVSLSHGLEFVTGVRPSATRLSYRTYTTFVAR